MLEVVDDVLLVADNDIEDAMIQLYELENMIVEPSAATGLAAIAKDPNPRAGQTLATIITGANIDPVLRNRLFA